MIRSFDSNQDATLLKSLDSFCWSSLSSFAEVFFGFFGRHFVVFGLNTESYRANLRIQSEYGKIRLG